MSHHSARYYLGIDPSLTKTGVAIILVSDRGVFKISEHIKAPKGGTLIERIVSLRDSISDYVQLVTTKYDCSGCCIEGPSLGSTSQQDTLGQVRGVLSAWLLDYHAIPTVVAPKSLKKYATKSGDASKETVIKEARISGWNIPEGTGSDDEADAAFLAEIARAIHDSNNMVLTRKQFEVLNTLNKLEVTNDEED